MKVPAILERNWAKVGRLNGSKTIQVPKLLGRLYGWLNEGDRLVVDEVVVDGQTVGWMFYKEEQHGRPQKASS